MKYIETKHGTIAYSEDKIRRCKNEVYKGVYLDGQHEGKQVILKYTNTAKEETSITNAISEIGIKTPQVLDSAENYMVLEYKEMVNLSYHLKEISPEKLAAELAELHATLYRNKEKLEDKIIRPETEKAKNESKFSNLTKEGTIRYILNAVMSAFNNTDAKLSWDSKIEKILSYVPENEFIGHRDLSLQNIITDGKDINFIDFEWLGRTSFANEIAKLVLCIKSENPDFAEKKFIDTYYTALEKQIGDKINKRKDRFLKEYKAAKITTGLTWALTNKTCEKDENRHSLAGKLDTFLHAAFDEMNDEQRNMFIDCVSYDNNEYEEDMLKSIQKWRKQNQSLAKRAWDDTKRSVNRNRGYYVIAGCTLALFIYTGYLFKEQQELMKQDGQFAQKLVEIFGPNEPIEKLQQKINKYKKEKELRYQRLSPEDRALYDAAVREARFAEERREWSKNIMGIVKRFDSDKRFNSFNSKHRINKKQDGKK